MLEVVAMEDATRIIESAFGTQRTSVEMHGLASACRRTLARGIVAQQGIPPFNRSTVDGFALRAADTFGCSEALPALLRLAGNVKMGEAAPGTCTPGECWAIPTGGEVPEGADAVVMIERTEDFGDGTIGIQSPVAPAANIIFAHDDVAPGQTLCQEGTWLEPHHIGALSSLGIAQVEVYAPVRVGVISTGDEIVPADAQPTGAQMRDVNGPMLAAAINTCGAQAAELGIVADNAEALAAAVAEAAQTYDVVLISGGSSVGQRDTTSVVLEQLGTILLHGIAMKPGKPTLVADLNGTPAFGLPGHPLAAYFVFLEFVRPLLMSMQGGAPATTHPQQANLSQAIPSNHGRAECVAVALDHKGQELVATPIRSKSGLVGLLAQASGYIVVPRDTEGLPAGARVDVKPF